MKKIKSEDNASKAFNKAWTKQIERNEREKYTAIEMVKIFFLGPYELFRYFNSELKELWDFNYKTKFRQKIVLLILGTIFWILFIVGIYKHSEYKRIQKIEQLEVFFEYKFNDNDMKRFFKLNK